MSIAFSNVDESICKKIAYASTSEFVRVTIDPATRHQINLPANYKYNEAILPIKYTKWIDRLRDFDVNKDDVWVVGFPKSGTTWIYNIVFQLKNNLNFDAPVRTPGHEYFESPILHEKFKNDDKSNVWVNEMEKRFDSFENMPSPRTLRSHLPAFLLPKKVYTTKSKVVYIARGPHDIVVSLYHNMRNNATKYSKSLEELCENFINDHIMFSSFFDHILSYWQLRHLDHVLVLTYEQLSADLFGGVKRVSEFMGCSYTDDQLKQLADHVSFGNMRKRFMVNAPEEAAKERQDAGYL